jgi:hypothetical protein
VLLPLLYDCKLSQFVCFLNGTCVRLVSAFSCNNVKCSDVPIQLICCVDGMKRRSGVYNLIQVIVLFPCSCTHIVIAFLPSCSYASMRCHAVSPLHGSRVSPRPGSRRLHQHRTVDLQDMLKSKGSFLHVAAGRLSDSNRVCTRSTWSSKRFIECECVGWQMWIWVFRILREAWSILWELRVVW